MLGTTALNNLACLTSLLISSIASTQFSLWTSSRTWPATSKIPRPGKLINTRHSETHHIVFAAASNFRLLLCSHSPNASMAAFTRGLRSTVSCSFLSCRKTGNAGVMAEGKQRFTEYKQDKADGSVNWAQEGKDAMKDWKPQVCAACYGEMCCNCTVHRLDPLCDNAGRRSTCSTSVIEYTPVSQLRECS